MSYLILGFFTGLSLILAIGAQNIFVIEQGLKKQHVFIICLICSASDLILIFSGIFFFHFFNQYLTTTVELIFNIFLIIFLIHFIFTKIRSYNLVVNLSKYSKKNTKTNIIFKTLAFTYLNPHVYSDTVFFLGNFSKNLFISEKIVFGIGASVASFVFFFLIGYLSKFFSKYAQNKKVWKVINLFIITFMSILTILIIKESLNYFK
jgi:L-lysine exporter family protein LysE/ArgO